MTMKMTKNLIASFLFITFLGGCGQWGAPPQLSLESKGEKWEATLGTYSWEEEGLFSTRATNADAAAPPHIAEDMEEAAMDAEQEVTLEFSDGSNPESAVYLWEGQSRGAELEMNGDKITFPSDEGTYVMEVMATWENGEASYTFLMKIN